MAPPLFPAKFFEKLQFLTKKFLELYNERAPDSLLAWLPSKTIFSIIHFSQNRASNNKIPPVLPTLLPEKIKFLKIKFALLETPEFSKYIVPYPILILF